MNIYVEPSSKPLDVSINTAGTSIQLDPQSIDPSYVDDPVELENRSDPVTVQMDQQVVVIHEGGSGLPPGGLAGDLLAKRTNTDGDVEWITPANSPEADNTRPITAAAVYTEIGNINALLRTI